MEQKILIMMSTEDLRTLILECLEQTLKNPVETKLDETLIKRNDVAKLFGISLVTLNSWMRDGRIIYHRINSRVFFKYHEVMAALQQTQRKRRK